MLVELFDTLIAFCTPALSGPTLAASVSAVPAATLVIRRSLPALPTDTVLAWLATDPCPRATALFAVTELPWPIAVPEAAATLAPSPLATALVAPAGITGLEVGSAACWGRVCP